MKKYTKRAKMAKIKFTKNEMISKNKRYPNLNTVLMVEKFLKEHRDIPIEIAQLKKSLPKKVMHQTLVVILDDLQRGGKILIGTKWVQWIYAPGEELNKLINEGIEI